MGKKKGGATTAAKAGKQQHPKGGKAGKAGAPSGAAPSAVAEAAVDAMLPEPERRFLTDCAKVPCGHVVGREFPTNEQKADEERAVAQAVASLETFHMCILENALSQEDVAQITADFAAMLDFKGDSAIGEKKASQRSATRMYNCKCQVGPACGWSGWKGDSLGTRERLHDDCRRPAVWERVCAHFDFTHIKRCEVVTSHPGCRAQGWHVDAMNGLTVIFPLVDVDARKGPTQLDFTIPFNNLLADGPKNKKRHEAAPESALHFHAPVSR